MIKTTTIRINHGADSVLSVQQVEITVLMTITIFNNGTNSIDTTIATSSTSTSSSGTTTSPSTSKYQYHPYPYSYGYLYSGCYRCQYHYYNDDDGFP